MVVERYRWEGLNSYEKVEFGLEDTYSKQKGMDMCIGYLGTYHDKPVH
jgi:hypothetical protein